MMELQILYKMKHPSTFDINRACENQMNKIQNLV